MTHRMMMLAIQLGVILFAVKLGNILFERIRLPGALGELVVGMIIGPYLLGSIGFNGFPDGLFPMSGEFPISPELYGLSSVAAIVLLFTVGLETDLGLLLRYSLAGGLAGLGGIIFSFAFGIGTVMLFSESIFGESLGPLAPQCLFMGLITTATSVGITARILAERRKLHSPEGVTILSAAVIDDVAGIILLAVVMGFATASEATGTVDWGHIGLIGAKAVGVWLAATIIGLITSRKISFLLKCFHDRTSIAIMAFGLALILAGFFEEAGLAMIIGAYVMGLSLSKADISHVVREKLEPIYALLVPIFFCVMGMRINFAELQDPAVILFGVFYAFAALMAKVLGCGLPAMLANFNLRGAMRIGLGMAPRCEVALIIAGIGLAAHIVSPAMFAAVIIMIIINTVIAPPALVLSFRKNRPGIRKKVRDEQTKAKVNFEFPSPEITEFMVDKLSSVFESEGFFVHLLSHDEKLYQLRKEAVIIDFTHSGTELEFHCNQGDVSLVNTAMLEAVAALEQAIREMRKPLDTDNIGTRFLQQSQFTPTGLDLRSYLTPSLIKPKLKGKTKEEIIDELLKVLLDNGHLKDVKAARKAVWSREKSMSTGLQYGVAIPHGKTDAVNRLVCAIGINAEGVDFASMDDLPAKIFILTLSPASKPTPHVQFMSSVSQVLNAKGRERILSGRNARDIYEAFITRPKAAQLAAIQKRKKRRQAAAATAQFDIKDYLRPELMITNLSGNNKEEIIRELLDSLDQHGLIRDAKAAYEAVMAREEKMSTGMEAGVAIPHGRTDAVDNLVCAVGIKPDGIDFNSADGQSSRIFVLLVTPKDGTDPYLQFVASVMGILDASGREKVLAAKTSEELYNIFLEEA